MTPTPGPDPTDAEIEERLRRTPPDRWAALWAAVDDVLAEESHGEWRGGEQIGTRSVGGEERPVHQMPYIVYSDAVDRMHAHLGGVGAVVPFPWPDWDGLQRYRGEGGAQALERAPVADAVRMITAVIRAERFNEGAIAAALQDGTLPAALRRLRSWHTHETDSHP